jgi:restriction system protein
MPIPDFQTLFLPVLKLFSDQQEHSRTDFIEQLGKAFGLNQEEMSDTLPSGQKRFSNRINWALLYLTKSGLLESTRRGYRKITQRGKEVIQSNLLRIDTNYLMRFPEFIKFHPPLKKVSDEPTSPKPIEPLTPEEQLQKVYLELRNELADEILGRLKSCHPSFFERIVIDVIVKMGYGGSRLDAGKVIGKSGDGGIDGIIKEDKLGLDTIYIQAKRWDNTVGRPEIQKFVGALTGQRAKKGLFITTSTFSNEAMEYASNIDMKVVLIDGETLAQYMIDYGVGVSVAAAYEVKRIDSDYFSDE